MEKFGSDGIEVGMRRRVSINQAFEIIRNEGNRHQLFDIDPKQNPVTEANLKALLSYSWEFSIHENNRRLFLIPGIEGHPVNSDRIGLTSESLLYLHSHPKNANPFLSMSDVFVSYRYGPKTQLFLLTGEGIVVYKRPQFDPVRQVPTDDTGRELMSVWGDKNKINFFNTNLRRGQKNFFDLQPKDQVPIVRAFCNDTKMIVFDLKWGSSEINKLVDAINLRKRISDNSAPKIPSIADNIPVKIEDLKLSTAQFSELDAAIHHFDMIKLRTGRLFKEKDLRIAWKRFAFELISSVRARGVDGKTERFLKKIEELGSKIEVE